MFNYSKRVIIVRGLIFAKNNVRLFSFVKCVFCFARRGACRSVYNTTSARLSVARKSKEKLVSNQLTPLPGLMPSSLHTLQEQAIPPQLEATQQTFSADSVSGTSPFFRQFAVELVHAGQTSPLRRSLPQNEALAPRRSAALVPVRPTSPTQLSPRRSAVALFHVRPTSPSRRSLSTPEALEH